LTGTLAGAGEVSGKGWHATPQAREGDRMKLTIIGGASAYTPDIILGLLQDHALYAGGELCLHDIDGANLRVIERLARALVRAAGADLRVTATLDRAEAITGSRFIL